MSDWRVGLAVLYVLFTLAMSVMAVIMMWWDKRQARSDKWRISEARLHWIELLGGWPGSFLARRWFRHKTVKMKYRLVFAMIVALHVVLIVGIVYLNVSR